MISSNTNMTITRSIKSKLDNYGVNLPTDRRTRAYANILRKIIGLMKHIKGT